MAKLSLVIVGLLLVLFVNAKAHALIIFSDDFNSGASPLWENDNGGWVASGGNYDATAPSTFPNAHSSLPFELTDFIVEFDVNDVEDGGIWLRSAAAPGTAIGRIGVLLVTGGGTGLYWHIVTAGNSYENILSEVLGLFIPGVTDTHLRLEVSGNTFSAFVGNSLVPATTLTTSLFPSGQVALYDFSGQSFDNVAVTAIPEPSIAVFLLLGVGALGAMRTWPSRTGVGQRRVNKARRGKNSIPSMAT